MVIFRWNRLQFYIAYIKNVEFNFSARAASLDYNHEKEYVINVVNDLWQVGGFHHQ
jgi:hypothetical protein